MDIGPALAEARTKAGMTIQDVSDRTRIRGKLISDIEHDDYSACGGDFYTRGHIRAIAKAVGTDPVPLIEQYDGNAAAATALELNVPDAEPPTKPQATWPGTRDPAQVEPKRAARSGHAPGRAPRANGASGIGRGASIGADPAVNGNRGGSADPAVSGRPGIDDLPGVDERPGADKLPGISDVPEVEEAPGVDAAPAVDEVPGVDDPEEPRGGDSAVTQELAIGGEATAPGPSRGSWQRPAAQAPVGPARLEAASDRLRQSAEGFRRASADAYRRAVPEARRVGEQARRAGEQTVRRAGTWARTATSGVYDRTSRLRTADRRLSVLIGAAVVVVVLVFLLIYFLVSGSSPASSRSAPAAKHQVSRSAPARRTSPTSAAHAHSHAAAHAASPTAGPLRPASVAAFGPGGTGQGDNPQQASLALSGRSGGWHTNWYASANFGNLQSGTGLLLNMGGAVTVTKATIDLGSATGGFLELRAGNQPVLADLLPVARSTGSGGTVTLAPGHPVAARYLLIWFTRLPADNSGTYQATIYHVRLTGFS